MQSIDIRPGTKVHIAYSKDDKSEYIASAIPDINLKVLVNRNYGTIYHTPKPLETHRYMIPLAYLLGVGPENIEFFYDTRIEGDKYKVYKVSYVNEYDSQVKFQVAVKVEFF